MITGGGSGSGRGGGGEGQVQREAAAAGNQKQPTCRRAASVQIHPLAAQGGGVHTAAASSPALLLLSAYVLACRTALCCAHLPQHGRFFSR